MTQLSNKLPWELAQTKWSAALNPVLALPMLAGIQIDDIDLAVTVPLAINHLLQRTPQGWFLVDNSANATVWRTAGFNPLTITLEASANTTVSIWIY